MILKTRAVAAIATPKRHPKFFWMAKTWDGQNVPALIEIPMSGRMPSVAFADNDFSDVQIGDLFFVENEASPHGHWKRMINQSESRDLRVPHFGEPRFLSKGTAAKPQFQACFPLPNERLYPSLSIFIHLYPSLSPMSKPLAQHPVSRHETHCRLDVLQKKHQYHGTSPYF
jgi:hypothetical protein